MTRVKRMKLRVKFYLRSDKNADGEQAIYATVYSKKHFTDSNKRWRLNIANIRAKHWNVKKGELRNVTESMSKGDAEYIRNAERAIEGAIAKVKNAEAYFTRLNVSRLSKEQFSREYELAYTTTDSKAIEGLEKERNRNQYDFVKYCNDYLKQQEKLHERKGAPSLKESTIKLYKSHLSIIDRFFKETKSDNTFRGITQDLVTNFEIWWLQEKDQRVFSGDASRNGIGAKQSFFKSMAKRAFENNKHNETAWRAIDVEKTDARQDVGLTDDEYKIATDPSKWNFERTSAKGKALDLFRVELYTGLRISDVLTLKQEDREVRNDREYIIIQETKTRQSTLNKQNKANDNKRPIRIDDKPELLEIFNFWSDYNKFCTLIVPAMQGARPYGYESVNKNIKAAFNTLLGRKITSHVARHTFAKKRSLEIDNVSELHKETGHSKKGGALEKVYLSKSAEGEIDASAKRDRIKAEKALLALGFKKEEIEGILNAKN